MGHLMEQVWQLAQNQKVLAVSTFLPVEADQLHDLIGMYSISLATGSRRSTFRIECISPHPPAALDDEVPEGVNLFSLKYCQHAPALLCRFRAAVIWSGFAHR